MQYLLYHAAVEQWLVGRAVLPIENSLGGSIHRNYDLLLRHRLHIVGEVHLPVHHCLLALPGSTPGQLTRVLSHPQVGVGGTGEDGGRRGGVNGEREGRAWQEGEAGCCCAGSATCCARPVHSVHLSHLPSLPPPVSPHFPSLHLSPTALAQCEATLTRLGVVQEAVYDTAGAAQMVANQKMEDVGAVASTRAAEIYGLEILAEGIQDEADNFTRFLALARDPVLPSTDRPFKVGAALHRPPLQGGCCRPPTAPSRWVLPSTDRPFKVGAAVHRPPLQGGCCPPPTAP
ncbi:unnamed protein product [Closterium sp. Naga37s-1]|nr:unnamed protein product [Closterium sp. Naga37s-1]